MQNNGTDKLFRQGLIFPQVEFAIFQEINIFATRMKLVVMTTPTFFVEEDKILAALFDEGLDNLHLYKPGASPVYCERLLSLLPDDCYRYITVHEHYYLKSEYDLGGIHLSAASEALPTGYRGNYSRTCTDAESLKTAKKKARYVFLKDVFGSSEAGNAEAAFTAEQLSEAGRRGLIDKHVYAWGGITADNIKAAKDMGFGGVVVCDDLWSRFDIHNETDYKELINHFLRLRKAAG